MSHYRPLMLLSILFIGRFVIASVHGHAHDELAVPLAIWQDVFVWSVIVLGPLVAIIWLWVRPRAWIAWTFAGLMIAGWLFGLYFHFGPTNPDHVSVQPAGHGRQLFVATAAMLGVIEPLTALAAVWLAQTLRIKARTSYA